MKGWIGVDLDGTLAEYDGWQGHAVIGAPISPMVERVKRWLDEGREVRVFTARMFDGGDEAQVAVREWTREHIGQSLVATCVKDFGMEELWDDRAVSVEPNTGRPLAPSRRGLEPDPPGEDQPEGPDQCPRCGSDDPEFAFDLLRPEQPRQPAVWIDSGKGVNWVCPDDFHREPDPRREARSSPKSANPAAVPALRSYGDSAAKSGCAAPSAPAATRTPPSPTRDQSSRRGRGSGSLTKPIGGRLWRGAASAKPS